MPLPQAQETQDAIALLDDLIPLNGASHADVVEYTVEIPMRYAQCFAVLQDGSKRPLLSPQRFIGWSGHDEDKSLLFRCNGSTLELGLTNREEAPLPGRIRNIIFEVLAPRCAATMKKFIGIDGELVYQPAT